MKNEKRFLRAKDIMEILDVSDGMAYKIIKDMNEELKEKGYYVQRGRLSRDYFEEKMYHRKSQ